jgi:hypothetical protein
MHQETQLGETHRIPPSHLRPPTIQTDVGQLADEAEGTLASAPRLSPLPDHGIVDPSRRPGASFSSAGYRSPKHSKQLSSRQCRWSQALVINLAGRLQVRRLVVVLNRGFRFY